MVSDQLPLGWADKKISALNRFRNRYTISELIAGIKDVRDKVGFIPAFLSDDHGSFYGLMHYIANSKELKPEDALELAKMLLSREKEASDEYALEQSYGNILRAMGRYPQPEFLPILEKLLRHFESEMEIAGWGTPRYALFAGDKRVVERIMSKL